MIGPAVSEPPDAVVKNRLVEDAVVAKSAVVVAFVVVVLPKMFPPVKVLFV